MTHHILSILKTVSNTAATDQTALLVLAGATATAAVVHSQKKKKKVTRLQAWTLRLVQKWKKKGNAGAILLGFLALLLGIACIAGIFYFMAVENYIMVIVCGIIPILIMLAALVARDK